MAAYTKPEIKVYSGADIIEAIGPCQGQYVSDISATFLTDTGNSSVRVDGVVASNGLIITDLNLPIGDGGGNEGRRGFVGFDISSIQGKTIVSATLRVYQYTITGGPYTNLGTLVVDHVTFGASLDAGDYSGGTWANNIGTISTNTTVEWKTLDVANYVQVDINNSRTASQFRIRFTTETNSDGMEDTAGFETSENPGGTGNRPELVITYH